MVRVVAILCAVALASMAAAGNAWFWYRINEGTAAAQAAGVLFAAVSFALKLGIPAYLASCGLRWRERPKLAFVACIAMAFDIVSGLGVVDLVRQDAAAYDRAVNVAATEARDKIPGLRAQLADLPHVKPSSWYKAQIDVQEQQAGDCPPPAKGRAPSDACARLATLRTEQATATTRDRIARELAAAEAVANQAKPRAARPEVAAVHNTLTALGVVVASEGLTVAINFLIFALFELAPVAIMAEMNRATSRPVPAPKPAPGTPGPAPAGGKAPRTRATGKPDVVDAVRALPADANGWRDAPQRQLAAAMKVSATTAGRAIRDAVAAGTLEIDRTTKGVRLRPRP